MILYDTCLRWRRIVHFQSFGLCLVLLLPTGCAIDLANNYAFRNEGRWAPPAPERNTPREEVYAKLGQATRSIDCNGAGVIDVYYYKDVPTGPDAADRTAAGLRGIVHAGLSGLTFFLWDIVGVPLEKQIQDSTKPESKFYVLVVEYGASGRVNSVRRERIEEPASHEVERCPSSPKADGPTSS